MTQGVEPIRIKVESSWARCIFNSPSHPLKHQGGIRGGATGPSWWGNRFPWRHVDRQWKVLQKGSAGSIGCGSSGAFRALCRACCLRQADCPEWVGSAECHEWLGSCGHQAGRWNFRRWHPGRRLAGSEEGLNVLNAELKVERSSFQKRSGWFELLVTHSYLAICPRKSFMYFSNVERFAIIPLKGKLECGFGFAWWWPVWTPPHGSRVLTGGSPVNSSHTVRMRQKRYEKMYV